MPRRPMPANALSTCRAAPRLSRMPGLAKGLAATLLAWGGLTAGPAWAQKPVAPTASPSTDSPTLRRISDTSVIVLGHRVG